MDSMNMRDARRRLSDIVDAAENGESVTITRHGRSVARIEPVQPPAAGPLPDLTQFRASLTVGGKAVSRIVAEARKQARY